MNKLFSTKALLLAIFAYGTLYSAPSHMLTFFVEPYPTENKEIKETTLQKNYKKGIFFTYFGYRTVSDNNGQVIFPLKTEKEKFYILVSDKAKPIFMLFNTIHHWELQEKSFYSLFSVERKYDEKLQLYFWSTEQIELPKNLVIPMNTILVHALPNSIFVPTGVTVTSKSPQLLLPPIYVKSEVRLAKSALCFLNNNEFFAQIERTFKKEGGAKELKI